MAPLCWVWVAHLIASSTKEAGGSARLVLVAVVAVGEVFVFVGEALVGVQVLVAP